MRSLRPGPRRFVRTKLPSTYVPYGVIQGDLSHVADNRQQAFAKLEDALKWSPEERKFVLQRAEWKMDSGQFEQALQDGNRLLERFPDDLELLRLRGKVFHLLGRHVEAVKDADRINNLSKTSGNPPRAEALNELVKNLVQNLHFLPFPEANKLLKI